MLLKFKGSQRGSSAVKNVCHSCRGLKGFWFLASTWAAQQLAVLWPQAHKRIQIKSFFFFKIENNSLSKTEGVAFNL